MKKLAFLLGFLFVIPAFAEEEVLEVTPEQYRNVMGIIDCIDCVGEKGYCVQNRKTKALTGKWQKGNVKFRSDASYNYHARSASCVPMRPDANYNKIKGRQIKTKWFGSDPVTVPDLENGKMYRYVATQCEEGYEIARNRNGESLGWCKKKSRGRRR